MSLKATRSPQNLSFSSRLQTRPPQPRMEALRDYLYHANQHGSGGSRLKGRLQLAQYAHR